MRLDCDDLCDTNSEAFAKPGTHFPKVKKRFECENLFSSIHIDKQMEHPKECTINDAPGICDVPLEVLHEFTYGGRIPLKERPEYQNNIHTQNVFDNIHGYWTLEWIDDYYREQYRNKDEKINDEIIKIRKGLNTLMKDKVKLGF